MNELRDVLLYVLHCAGPRGVNRTALIKLVYFAELESWRQRGEPLTGTPFYCYHYGAYAPEVPFVAEHVPEIKHSRFQGFDKPEHRYELKPGTALPALSPIARDIVFRVCAAHGASTATKLGRLSKKTEPMQGAEKGVRLDFSVVAPQQERRLAINPRLVAARERLDLSVRGSAEERAAQEQRDLADLAPYRARVGAGIDRS